MSSGNFHVSRSKQNTKVFSIGDQIVFIFGHFNPNVNVDGLGTEAPLGTQFMESAPSTTAGTFWIKQDPGPFGWDTWKNIGSSRMVVTFGYDGTAVSVKFLEAFHSISSDKSPFVMAEDATVKALSIHTDGVSTATYDVLKNGSTIDTLSLVAADKNSKKDLNLGFVINDELGVKISSGSAKNSLFNVFVETVRTGP